MQTVNDQSALRATFVAVEARVSGAQNPLDQLDAEAWRVARARFRTEGPMAREISLENQRAAAHVFEQLVRQASAPAAPKAAPRASDEAEVRHEHSHAA